MICSWNKLVGVTLILFQITSLIQCFCDSRAPYFPVYYPEPGYSFTVDVVGVPFKDHVWRKDGRQLVLPTCDDHNNDTNCPHPIYLFPNRADLNFKKITIEDSGKYILEVFCSDTEIHRINSFEIIVQDKPFVLSDCKDMTVKEGDNVTCVCKTTTGYPSAEVNWTRTQPEQENSGLNNLSGVLRLENISRNQSGTYTCFAKSQKFVNTTSFNLKVVPKNVTSKVKIKYFQVFRRAGDGKLVIICKAKGIPEPRYTISLNGIAVEYRNMYIVDTRNKSSRGQYECLASNKVGSDRRLLCLNESFIDKKNYVVEEKVVYEPEIEWKFVSIIAACSFLAGILFVCILTCLCKKFAKKDDHIYENSDNADVSPQSAQVGTEARIENQENTIVRHTGNGLARNEEEHDNIEYELSVYIDVVDDTTDHVHCNDNETCYQELSEFRETDDERYQSLNEIPI